METISTDAAPRPLAAYSQARCAAGLLFSAGQIGIDPASGNLAAGLEAQAEQAFKNVAAILKAAGLSFANVLKVSLYVTDLGQFAAVNAIYERYVGASRPARTTVEVSALPRAALLEVDVIAAAAKESAP
jgi:reactive intermediate/imine deaminase